MQAKDRLIIALDVPELKDALKLVSETRDSCSVYKVGLELFLRSGTRSVQRIQALGVDVFLDLKLHDIPNTVYSALLQVLPLAPAFVTVHASGGPAMLDAAEKALRQAQGSRPQTRLLAVSVLTHLTPRSLRELGLFMPPAQLAAQWLKPVKDRPSFGAVCSPQELPLLRSRVPAAFKLVCPGIRPQMTEQNDQSRIATPAKALHSGADYLVVGRPISRAASPQNAARLIINEMESALEAQNSHSAKEQRAC